jgi:selenocysteine lyase/cysteine desulfurase
MKIGTFSAGSNITGIINDVDRISLILHQQGFLAFFDYAAVAPYIKMNMNGPTSLFPSPPNLSHLCYKDALFISPHKFVGAPDTPGILCCKKELLQN